MLEKLLALLFGKTKTVTKLEEPVQQTVSPQAPVQVQVQPAPVREGPSDRELISEATLRAKEIVLEARDQAIRIKSDAEVSVKKLHEEVLKLEKDLNVQKAQADAKDKELEDRTKTLRVAKEAIDKKQLEADELFQKQKDQLEKVASLTKEEAKKLLLEQLNKELSEEKGKRIRQIEEDIKKDADKLAQEILIDAMKYGATDLVVEHTTSKVKLPDDDLKGRIIGKEGRNIQTFEEITGVELDLDSAPGEVIVSSFDPVRREIAKLSLERLIADGRIQPAKIEEIVEKTKKEIEHVMFKEGDNLCHRVGVYNLPNDLIQMLGRFKYRFSYGQNMIEHTLEETRIGVAIATELKVDIETVKLGCLFHDIGKIVNDEEGTHVQLGVDLLKKYGISEKVINCVAEHHEDKPASSIESAIVALADHISGARPGARSEDYGSYVQRMKDLEEAATTFDGVDKAYAISAGREVRVFVKPERVDDSSVALLAREIARKIELEQTYPGVVKVTVIRETRVSETAK
ncbi:MAG: hypothetical protein ACD_22C00062G0001 [uncultured bacterium]|nr:MAG: hypothetical protein ACD_22C00062G0001 [uncultured bacterium]